MNDMLDAARLHALLMCPSIRMHGSAGVDTKTGARLYEPGGVHFGGWFMPEDGGGSPSPWARHCLLALAADIIECEGGKAPSSDVGNSDLDDALRFRALLRCPRIRVIHHHGARLAGHLPIPGTSTPGHFAFRAEFWPTGVADDQTDPVLGRACLLTLAHDLLRLAA